MSTPTASPRRPTPKSGKAGLNIDCFPTDFVARDGLLWYIDYERNGYTDEWSFENRGVQYRSRTPAFEAYLAL